MSTTRRRTRSAAHRRTLAATATAAVITVVLAGCTKEEKAVPSPPSLSAPAAPTASPSPSADPLAADKAEVRTAYERYWSVVAAAYSKADSKDTDLKKVATGSAYARIEGGLINLRNAGQVTVGSPQYSDTSISFKEGTKLKTAVITGCTDISKWKPVDKKTGQEISLPAERRLRYITTLTAEKWPTGWMILEEKIQDQAC